MIARFDYSLPFPLLSALLMGAALPIILAIVSRIPRLSGRNALQFLIASLLMMAAWGGLVAVRSGSTPVRVVDVAVGMMGMGAEVLFLLEVWSLLSRGYTLGLLLTLYCAGGSLDERELARRYRGGEGLSWIMRHRLSALVRTGLVQHRGDIVTLTSTRGLPIAWLYRISVGVLGLRQAGR